MIDKESKIAVLHKAPRNLVVIALILASGCTTGINSGEVSLTSEYEACIDEAWAADRQAHHLNGEPQFLLSAKLFANCGSQEFVDSSSVADKESMLPAAMATLNYARGGDIQSANQQLSVFEARFPGWDLYFRNGVSFIDTMRLINQNQDINSAQLRLMNVSDDMRDEVMRLRNSHIGDS